MSTKLTSLEIDFRKKLDGDSFFCSIRSAFSKIPDHRASNVSYKLTDMLMSGFSIFVLKSSSLLAHENMIHRKMLSKNFASVFKVLNLPSDTQIRTVLDKVDTSLLQDCLTDTVKLTNKTGLIKEYQFLSEDILVSIDGTGFFCSNEVKCDQCQVKHRKSGDEYSHAMFAASIVHPKKKQVLPLAPEPIIKQDGKRKNDHETRAAERFLRRLRNDFPELKATIIADGLFSKAPTVKLCKELGFNFIFGAKPKDHKYLFECFEKKTKWAGIDHMSGSDEPIVQEYTIKKEGVTHKFQFANDMSLNQSNDEIKVGFILYTEITKKGSQTFSWVTSHKITKKNVFKLMQAARSRWKIENETFNTLKNQGYNFEHNYGHGYENLSNNMAILMMLAFLVDQVQESISEVFQGIRDLANSRRAMWEAFRSCFCWVSVKSWAMLLVLVLDHF